MIQIHENCGIVVGLDTAIPEKIVTGHGSVLYISGWYLHPNDTIDQVSLLVNAKEIQFTGPPVTRKIENNLSFLSPDDDSGKMVRGFWFLAPCVSEQDVVIEFTLVFSLKNSGIKRFSIGKAEIIQEMEESIQKKCNLYEYIEKQPGSSWPLIVIGLATYNPDTEAFIRQISSIRNQTYPNWICLIQDDHSLDERKKFITDTISEDKRFLFHSNNVNLGFYHNFESIIRCIPDTVPYVALSDQDDFWYPEKLMRLYQGFDGEVSLVYSDMRIVERDGSIRLQSFWSHRSRSDTLCMQILNNSVTGASCMFRGVLCKKLLPFPVDIGAIFQEPLIAFHDHWIGCAALGAGKIRFLDEPLYDYYQHTENAAGYAMALSGYQQWKETIRTWNKQGFLPFLLNSQKKYLTHGVQRLCMINTILLRNPDLSGTKQQQLREISRVFTSGMKMFFFVIRHLNKREITGDQDKLLLLGYISGKVLSLCTEYSSAPRVRLNRL